MEGLFKKFMIKCDQTRRSGALLKCDKIKKRQIYYDQFLASPYQKKKKKKLSRVRVGPLFMDLKIQTHKNIFSSNTDEFNRYGSTFV